MPTIKKLTKKIKVAIIEHRIKNTKLDIRRTRREIKTKVGGTLTFIPINKFGIKKRKLFLKKQQKKQKLLNIRLKKLQKIKQGKR